MTDEYELNLIRRVVDGDHHAFRYLVASYKDRSMSLAQSILKDHALAEDALQESFVKVYNKLKYFKPEAKFSTWLYRIVVNTCYRIYNQQKSRVQRESLYAENNYDHDVNKDPLQYKQQDYINRIMDDLKPDEALLLRLYYLEELSLKDIQAITGFGQSKVKVDLHRGRVHFNALLQKHYGKADEALL